MFQCLILQAVIESMTPVVDKYSDLSSCLFMIDTKGDGSKDSTENKEAGATPTSDQPIKKLKRRNAAMYARILGLLFIVLE